MERLNFSWVIPNRLAGCAGPTSNSDLEFLKEKGITLLVRLTEKHEAKVTPQQVKKADLEDLPEPVPDLKAPSQERIDKITKRIIDYLNMGKPVAVSCVGGIYRTGTILSCILISLCYTVDEAVQKVQKTRKQDRVWEGPEQYQAILTHAKRIGKP